MIVKLLYLERTYKVEIAKNVLLVFVLSSFQTYRDN